MTVVWLLEGVPEGSNEWDRPARHSAVLHLTGRRRVQQKRRAVPERQKSRSNLPHHGGPLVRLHVPGGP